MKKSILVLTAAATLAVWNPVHAQEADTTAAWTKTLVGRLSGAQAGFSNWAEGGVNTLALTVGLDGKATHEGAKWNQVHELRFSFGLVRQDTLEVRKAEDLIRLRSSLKYTAGEGVLAYLQPTVAAGFRSQFAPGKNFDKDPLGLGRPLPVKVSDLFSPATITQTVGLTWDPSTWITQRLGFSAKETVVMIDELRPLYGFEDDQLDQSVRFEAGIEAYTDLEKQLAPNVLYKSTLGLFAAFGSADAPDMIWENAIAMKVNSSLNVNFEWTLLYDKDVASEIQAKEVFSVGFSYAFL
ncbi:MAG: DUF3078 domain-containing protein [Rhodothermales bacterium]|nr:DUF3078 domain-containing protein [Rhodothermales bacterium]